MKFSELKQIVSNDRLNRYLKACNGNKYKALCLYRYNIRASLEMFAVIGAFEIALRNAINRLMCSNFDKRWLYPKDIARMPFGFWMNMFDKNEFRETKQIMLKVFPNKPKSSKEKQYNNIFFHDELDFLRQIRNEIAHHEPICFEPDKQKPSIGYITKNYERMLELFGWMGIDHRRYLRGLDHVKEACEKIDRLAKTIK